ncbi:30S ribosomal protein S16 [Candidatus Kaiserbacteria bacterium]|nr:30S ribosomal protein S16 [Candidatus Kaiserbacteria bacterium]
MLKIRLARIGRKNDPSYRVIVTEHARGPQAGKSIEVLGNYNPRLNTLSLEGERIVHWMGKGAQVSDTVHNLLVSQKIIEGKKINVLPRKSPVVKGNDMAKTVIKAGEMAETSTVAASTESVSEKEQKPVETAESPRESIQTAEKEKEVKK